MMNRQVKRSHSPRSRVDQHAAPRLARRLGPLKGGMTSATWAVALLGVFVVGIGLGAAGAYWFGASEPRHATGSVQLDPRYGQEQDVGYALSVRVESSEKARARYEESLARQPDDVRPDPDAAPPEALAAIVAAAIAEGEPMAPATQPDALDADVAALAAPTDIPAVAAPPRGGDQAWVSNAAPFVADPLRPMIAIVIDDVGLDQPRSRRAIALPGPLTIAMLPYGYHLPEHGAAARRNGHELLVHMPMEPLDVEANPGPNALLTHLGEAELRRRIAWDLEQFTGYVGLNNHMGSRFTANPDGMRIVLEEARARGLMFLDSVTNRKTQGYRLAARIGLPYAVRDIFLDHDVALPSIRLQLEKVEKTALRQGHAIAIGHPHDATVTALREWLPTLRDKGFQLVPITAIVRNRLASG